MNLIETIITITTELRANFEKTARLKVDFSSPSDTWLPAMIERNGCVERIDLLEKSLRPLVAQWKREKNLYNMNTQERVQKCIDEYLVSLNILLKENLKMYEEAKQEKVTVQNRLSLLKDSTHAIACYASH